MGKLRVVDLDFYVHKKDLESLIDKWEFEERETERVQRTTKSRIVETDMAGRQTALLECIENLKEKMKNGVLR